MVAVGRWEKLNGADTPIDGEMICSAKVEADCCSISCAGALFGIAPVCSKLSDIVVEAE